VLDAQDVALLQHQVRLTFLDPVHSRGMLACCSKDRSRNFLSRLELPLNLRSDATLCGMNLTTDSALYQSARSAQDKSSTTYRLAMYGHDRAGCEKAFLQSTVWKPVKNSRLDADLFVHHPQSVAVTELRSDMEDVHP
jgi:hypothetical protein